MDNNLNMSAANITSNVLAADNVKCEKCGSYFFRETTVLKKLSALISPTGKEEVFPIPLWICDKCGEVISLYKNNKNFSKIVPQDNNDIKTTFLKDF